MNRKDNLRSIAESIVNKNCIAFIGAGVSATINKESFGFLPGLPLSSNLLDTLKNTGRDYLKECNNIGEATFLLKEYEDRQKLEEFLVKELDVKEVAPLPCHKILSKIDFYAYISMNFDELLEIALREQNKKIHPIIHDNDISRIRHSDIAIIKPHGTIGQPRTLKIASDEIFDFPKVLELYLSSMLLNKTVLFIGFGLNDPDFISLIRYIGKKIDPQYLPQSYAVVKEKSNFLDKYWQKHKINIIEEDATDFLTDLQLELTNLIKNNIAEQWMKKKYFSKFLNQPTIPTETQIIESLIDGILLDVNSNRPISQIEHEAMISIEFVLKEKKKYTSLEEIKNDLKNYFELAKKSEYSPIDGIRKIKENLNQVRKDIQNQNNKIATYKKILLYSQSQRVIDLLHAIPEQNQAEIELYIVECREKCMAGFAEAAAIANLLSGTKFKMVFITDITGLKYVSEKRIDLILLGVHSIQIDDKGNFTGFTNTFGSKIFSERAVSNKVDVCIVFEKDKVKSTLQNTEDLNKPEIDLSDKIFKKITPEHFTQNAAKFENYGYDFVEWDESFIVITNE